jgi:hypothetical protein
MKLVTRIALVLTVPFWLVIGVILGVAVGIVVGLQSMADLLIDEWRAA